MIGHLLKTSLTVSLLLILTACQVPEGPGVSAIAHAGGGVHNKRYTNSLEALSHNYERGFHLFELDFSWTTDGHLVCLHDWDKTPKWLLGYREEQATTLQHFNTLKNEQFNLKPCDLASLNQWMIEHPKAYIVTDIKGKNTTGLKLILTALKDAKTRVIPQFTQPLHYPLIRDMGYQRLIWTLFSYKEDNASVVREAGQMDLFAITMPRNRAQTGLAKLLKPLHIPTYVHTINDLQEALNYQKEFGLTSVYTDFLDKDLSSRAE